MEKEQRQAQSMAAKAERDKNHAHNLMLAHGIFWHGLYYFVGMARQRLPKKARVFKYKLR